MHLESLLHSGLAAPLPQQRGDKAHGSSQQLWDAVLDVQVLPQQAPLHLHVQRATLQNSGMVRQVADLVTFSKYERKQRMICTYAMFFYKMKRVLPRGCMQQLHILEQNRNCPGRLPARAPPQALRDPH